MGLSTRIITSEFPAEIQVDERLYRIERGKALYAAPRAHMLLFFLAVDHEIEVEGEAVRWVLRPNDACVLPRAHPRVYRPLRKRGASRMHVLRVIFNFAEDLGLPSSREARSKDGADVKGASGPAGKARKVLSLDGPQHNEIEWLKRYQTPQDFTFEFGPDALDCLRTFVRRPRHLPGLVTPAVHERIKEFRREVDERPPGYKLRIAAMMLEFAVLCARTVADQAEPVTRAAQAPTSRGELMTRRTKEFLFENHAKPLTLDEIAWQLKLSPEHVSRTFRQKTGMTVFDYLRFVRVDLAQQLLADSSRLVSDVARSVGYSTPTLFGRAFKRETGMTPQAYRQRALAQTHFGPSVQV